MIVRPSMCFMTVLENVTGRKVSLCVLLAGVFFVTGGWAAGRADQPRQSFIDGLLERRLYPLAAEYCEDQLDRENLTARQRMQTTVDLSRTFAEWAIMSSPDQRGDRWAQAQRVLDQLMIAEKDNPYLPLVRRQAADVSLVHGKFSRHEAESAGNREQLLTKARQQLQQSVALFEDLLLELGKLIEQYHGESSQENRLSERQLVSLQRETREGLADALMNQAVCYPNSSPDRINALQRAEAHLKILTSGNHPDRWTNRVRLLRCLRLFGQVDQFRQRAERDLAEHPPADAAAGIHIELARQLASEEKYGEAIGILDSAPPCGKGTQAALDFLELEILLSAAGKAASRTDGDWQQRAIHQVRTIEQQHAPYWMRRAESLLGRYVASNSRSQDTEMLQRAAQAFYRAGQMEEAVAAYDRAATRAMQENLFQQAYRLGHTAAMIEHEQKNYRKASERFLKLARKHHKQKSAAESHLMAAYDLAQAMREKPEYGLRDYLALLQEHLRIWPQAATANQARLWLGQIFESQRQWKQAIDVLFDVDPDSNYFPAAVSVASICCERYCEELAAQSDPQLKEQATSIADRLVKFARRLLETTVVSNRAAARAAISSAHIRLKYTRSGYQKVEQLLRAVRDHQPDAAPDLSARLHVLLVQALAGEGDLRAAREKLETTPDVGDEYLLQLIEGLNTLLAAKAAPHRKALAKLQLDCFEKLAGDLGRFATGDRVHLGLARAEALEVVGRREEALAILKALADEKPQRGKIQTKYASILLDQNDARSLQLALNKWREIERRSNHKSARWFEAKYAQAEAHRKLGSPEVALRIIRMTEVLHPDLGGPVMKQRFMKLLALCEPADTAP